jgi:hypothetical protein
MRPRLALLVILAFAAALFAPPRASWACPNGTPCVSGPGPEYTCAAPAPARSACCKAEQPKVCRHGALPIVPSEATVGAPEECRFDRSARPDLTAAARLSVPLLPQAPDALPAPVVLPGASAPLTRLRWLSGVGLRYRPPPDLSTGPSRAPPVP